MLIFKTLKECDDWECGKLDLRLQVIVIWLLGYVEQYFHLELVITQIFRSQQEQDEIYKDNENYKVKPWASVHQYWRGVDIRISDFTTEQQKTILGLLNNIFSYATPGKFTALIHDVGQGKHLHIQVDNTNITMIRKEVKV